MFHPDLRGERGFCGPFAIKGQYCADDNCQKGHLPFYRWPQEKKAKQISHVEQKQDIVRFNTEMVRPHNLPEDKRHLLGNGA